MSIDSTSAATDGPADLAEDDVIRLRDRLIVQCAHHAALARDYRETVADLAGRADVRSHHEREFVDVALSRSNEAIIEIFNALLRIDAGTYGMCVQCGGPIPLHRLDASPRERFCFSCSDSAPNTPTWRASRAPRPATNGSRTV